MIDSHTHLDLCEGESAELVAEAQAAGVNRLLTVGTTVEGSQQAIELAKAFPGTVFAAAGCHPNEANNWDEKTRAALHRLARDERCVAIGETGLDYFRDYAQPEKQRTAFQAQIELARELNKPLIIHCRAAEEELLTILEEQATTLDVILHCFSMPDQLERCLAQPRWWFSFAGNVTYPANKALAQAAEAVPENRILVETDAPYLTPQVFRGRRNRPAYVVETATFLAQRRSTDFQHFANQLVENADRLFRWQ